MNNGGKITEKIDTCLGDGDEGKAKVWRKGFEGLGTVNL